jgi:hypothetical protein
MIALLITPMITSGTAPPLTAAWKTANFAVKPLASEIPTNAIRKKANTSATSGERRLRPVQRDRCPASPPGSRTRGRMANTAAIEMP